MARLIWIRGASLSFFLVLFAVLFVEPEKEIKPRDAKMKDAACVFA